MPKARDPDPNAIPAKEAGLCPFCWRDDSYRYVEGWEACLVECCHDYSGCGARGPWADTREEALSRWNAMCSAVSDAGGL
jgi:hypothetical protein